LARAALHFNKEAFMNFNPGDVLTPRYDLFLVACSYIVSVLGSLAALECARHLVRADKSTDWLMTGAAAVALGGVGIWSMHFIAMLAYRLPIPISYNIVLSLVSLIAAVVIAGLALYLAGGRGGFRVSGWVAASIVAGVGVCVMHYLGMYGQVMRAYLSWNYAIVGLSFCIAMAAAGAALWLAFNLHRFVLRVLAAFVMGVAVCAMHYTGMAAAQVICTTAQPQDSSWALSGTTLQFWVLTVTATVLGLIAFAVVNRNMEQQFMSLHAQQMQRTS
jgi:NO-binding membrane sensor protein with MHYT domain